MSANRFKSNSRWKSARLVITALGLYECEINGQRIGDEVFAPGWTDYRKRVQYQTYDVTAHLQQGENELGAILGDGWYCGIVGWIGRVRFTATARAYWPGLKSRCRTVPPSISSPIPPRGKRRPARSSKATSWHGRSL